MSAVVPVERRDLTLADVGQVIYYARTVLPSAPPPDVTRYPHGSPRVHTVLAVRLHDVPVDVFAAMLATHDDLAWEVTDWPDVDDRGAYRSAELRCEHARLVVFSQHAPSRPAPFDGDDHQEPRS